ncbi:YcaO-like family protein, partial [Candidatus Peregrinibacteria bacterium]|nr:YcaO-like family protein [Candidatus Peregrinibacteria bacterium]
MNKTVVQKKNNCGPSKLSNLFSEPFFYIKEAFVVSPIISSVLLQITRVPHKYAKVFISKGTASHLSKFINSDMFSFIQQGEGVDLSSNEVALRKSVFELSERVWSVRYNLDHMIYDCYRNLQGKAISPQTFSLLTEREYSLTGDRYIKYSDDIQLHWSLCKKLGPNQFDEFLIPSALIYPGFISANPEERFVPTLSAGLAAGERYDETILRGIYELLERDAFAITWLNRLSPPKIPTGFTNKADVNVVINKLNQDGFRVNFFDLTLDIPIPVALTIIDSQRDNEEGVVSLGLGCSIDPRIAVVKSFNEALKMMLNHYSFPQGRLVKWIGSAGDSVGKYFEQMCFLGKSSKESELFKPDREFKMRPPEELVNCMELLKMSSFEIYFLDITPQEIKGNSKYCLVRVLIPGLQPHLYENNCWRLGNPRVFEVPFRIGRAAKKSEESELNQVLNPFALV